MYKHILIATDGSELAAKAVTQGLALAKALGAKATVVTVSEPWNFVLAALAERASTRPLAMTSARRRQPKGSFGSCIR